MPGKGKSFICRLSVLVLVLAAFPVQGAAKDFGPALSIAKVLKIARERNEDFLISKEQLKQTKLIRDKAWAAFGPVLGLSATLTHSDKEIVFNDRVILKQDALAGKGSATLNFFSGSAIAGVIEAYATAKAGEESARNAMNELSFEVARSFYAVLASRNLVDAAERSVQTAEEHLAAVTIRIEAGDALIIDETRARLELVSAQGDLINARNARDSAEDYLAFLLAMDPPLYLAQPGPIKVPDKSEEELTEFALAHRPDLAAMGYTVKAAKKAAAGSWLDLLPSFGVAGNFNATENTGFSGDPFSWNITLFAEWILWDGGFTRASIVENKSKLKEAKLEEDKLERSVKVQVRQARRDLDNAEANVATAGEQLELARQSRDMVLSRYSAGLATSLELTEADDQLRQAEVLMVAQELNYSLSALELLRVIGLDPLGKEVPQP
jgi:outer membrane protein TolC